MDTKRRDAEYSLPPPEFTEPAREFRTDPVLEYTPLPPEYGQGTQPQAPKPEKKRRLRKLLAVPAVLLLGFMFTHVTGASQGGPAAPPDLAKGDVVIDVIDEYTEIQGNTVNYRYQLYLRDSKADGVFGDPDMPWPVEVYASVIDEDGLTAVPESDPDIWTEGRSLGEHTIDAKGLKGDLLLCLRAEYTQDGSQRRTTVYVPLARDPGSCSFMIDYAMLDPSNRHVDFEYLVDRRGSEEMIVPVYATLIDSEGRTSHPGVNPVMWSSDPFLDPDSKWASAAGLNDDLTLILRTEYTGADGRKHTSMASRQVVILGRSTEFEDYPPDTAASIDSITRTDVTFTASFKTHQLSGSYFDMTPYTLSMVWLDENEEELYRDYLDPEGLQIEKSYDPAKSPPWGEWPDWSFTYSGGHWFYDNSFYDKSEFVGRESAVYAELTLYNRFDGRRYTLRSDPVPAPPEEITYPLGDGQIILTVYNDTTSFDVKTPLEIGYIGALEQKTFSEASFTSYKLPSAIKPSGYSFAGWVIHVGSPLDNGGDTSGLKGYGGDPPAEALLTEGSFAFKVGDTLTGEDIERVPPSADGKRYVNVHAVWIMTTPSDVRLKLDDGMGNVTGYDMMVPLASEGFLYLCCYPEPTREGYVFDGWYDADGSRVDMLVCYFSFTPYKTDANGGFAGYDWSKKQTVTLTAHWKKK